MFGREHAAKTVKGQQPVEDSTWTWNKKIVRHGGLTRGGKQRIGDTEERRQVERGLKNDSNPNPTLLQGPHRPPPVSCSEALHEISSLDPSINPAPTLDAWSSQPKQKTPSVVTHILFIQPHLLSQSLSILSPGSTNNECTLHPVSKTF